MAEFGLQGKPWKAEKTCRKFSPINYVTNVKTPLLIWHGENDKRVPLSQSQVFYRAVKKMGYRFMKGAGEEKDLEFVIYPGEGHGVSKREFEMDLLNRQLNWLARYLR
jgi:prolyl oligopeptidase